MRRIEWKGARGDGCGAETDSETESGNGLDRRRKDFEIDLRLDTSSVYLQVPVSQLVGILASILTRGSGSLVPTGMSGSEYGFPG
jgi:hypothetical protein